MKRFIVLSAITLTLCCCLASCIKSGLLEGGDLNGAVVSGNLERVKEAVENGADVNKNSILYALHEVPLLYSIHNGQRCIPEYLLSVGANPNYIDKRNGISLLMYAVGARAEAGITYANATDNDVYKVLLENKETNVNLTGRLGYTALDYACRDNGDLEIVEALIRRGAVITTTTMQCAFNGYVKASCEESVIKLVFDRLTEQGIPSGLPPEVESALRQDSSNLISLSKSIPNENKLPVLYLTCAFGDAEALEALCDETVKINEIRYPKTLLGVACAYGNLEIVEYLLSRQADVEIITDDSLSEKPPLTYALQYNHLDIADTLFERGATLQIAADGMSGVPDVLEIACRNGDLDTIKWIITHGYPLDEERAEKSMAKAACYGHIDALKYFFEELHVDINSEYYHSTVLTSSANAADLETIQFLVNSGADVNGGKTRVFTPLDQAVMGNRADVVRYLLDNGADADFVGTKDGYTPSRPLTVAIQHGFYDIVKMLVDHGVDLHYSEGWTSGKDTPLEIAKREKSSHIIDYIDNAIHGS